MDFVNLYTTTEYSMLESPSKIKDLVFIAKQYGYKALGISDNNTTSGIIKFYLECIANDIKPIIGLKVDVVSIFYNSILIYAKDNEGYCNLLKIASKSKIDKANLTLNYLRSHSKGLIAVIPNDENEIVKLFKEKSYDKAIEMIGLYKLVFQDLYMGIDLQTEENRIIIDDLISFCKKVNVQAVAINKTVYLQQDDFEVYQVLRCIEHNINSYPYTEKEMSMALKSVKDICYLFKSYPQLITNTIKIANECNVKIEFGNYKLPMYVTEYNNREEYLIDLCKFGLNKRLKDRNVNFEEYKNRLFHELDIINKMGFSDYFLIVYDFIKYAKKNDILVGPGRGSAPGSLVSYCLGITDIDPIEHHLLFERFLNPERISMPDIDTDFPDNKRDEVIKYVGSRYGKMKVAHITTFGTFGIRSAVRDVVRVLKIKDVYLNEMLKFIPNDGVMEKLLESSDGLIRLVNENEEIKKITKLVMKLEGLPRHSSTHAAGIVITKDDLVNYTALQNGINDLYQTQYEASDLEKLGLVKMDFLGLRNLTIIDSVVKIITNNEDPNFKLSKIPFDDQETFNMIARGDTDGIFQLESSGMRNVLGMLKASSFIDIVNANALFRPGPMEMIPQFVKRKFHQEPIHYIHPDLKEILSSTYGIIVFQEQIMLIVQKIADYSLGEADILRRAVSKKDAQVLINERAKFVSRAIKKGYNEQVSNEIYDYIVKFANYGFNKSHSVAYATIAYQMAYLKRNYFKYFMVVLMTNSIGSVGLIKTYITDCYKKGINVHIPSINISSSEFLVKENIIYFPLLGIQNVGSVTVTSLLEERGQNGVYKDYREFVGRTKNILNKRIVESLIHAGALDEFNIPRKQMVLEYDNLLDLSSFLDVLSDKLVDKGFSNEEYTFEEISNLEREALGFNLKYSVFKRYESFKEQQKICDLIDVKVNQINTLLFSIKRVRKIKTKNNDDMAFIEIFDDSNTIDAVLFPNVFEKCKDVLLEGKIYIGTGKIEERNGKMQFVVNTIYIAK